MFQVNGSRIFWAITYIVDRSMLSTLRGLDFKIFSDPGDQAQGINPWMVIGLPPRWKGIEGDFQTEFLDAHDELRFVDFHGYLAHDAMFIDVRHACQRIESQQHSKAMLEKTDYIFALALEVAVVGRPTSNWIG